MTLSELERVDGWWRALNRPFELNDYRGPATGPASRIRLRASPLVLSAVHSVRHYRLGTGLKPADANTGGLVLALSMYLNLGSAVVLRRGSNAGDANDVRDHPLKLDLARELSREGGPHTLVDVHGMQDDVNYDVALGLGRNPPAAVVRAAHQIATAFERSGLRVDLGGRRVGLAALGKRTMVAWARDQGICGVQLEIARHCRTFRGPPDSRRQLLTAFLSGLRSLEADH